MDEPNLEIIASPREDLPPAVKTKNVFELGAKVKDRLTGVEGVAVLRIKHRHSGDRYGIQLPVNKDGKVPEIIVLDEEDLELVKSPLPPKKAEKKPPNGPHGRKWLAR